MKITKLSLGLLAFALGNISGCSGTSAKPSDISEIIRTSLHQVQSISRSFGGSHAVAGQITVIPLDMGSDAGPANPNPDSAPMESRMNDGVKYDFKNGVATLTGEVNTQSSRATTEKVASGVPNAPQVVNELQLTNPNAGFSY